MINFKQSAKWHIIKILLRLIYLGIWSKIQSETAKEHGFIEGKGSSNAVLLLIKITESLDVNENYICTTLITLKILIELDMKI